MSQLIAISGWGYSEESIEVLRSSLGYSGLSLSVDSLFSKNDPLTSLEDALPKQACHVLAWSLGGMLALELLSTRETNISSITLIGAGARFVRGEGNRQGMPAGIVGKMNERLKLEPEEVVSEFATSVSPLSVDYSVRENLNPELLCALSHGLLFLQKYDIRSKLSSIKIPVSVIHGALDRIVPESASRELCKGIDSHEYHLLDNSGHMPWLDDLSACRDIILPFLDKFVA